MPVSKENKLLWLPWAIIVAVVLIDQIVKIYVKTHFYLGEDLAVTDWFHIKFIENNGMAFGIELWSKVLLTIGRIIAVAAFIWFIVQLGKSPGKLRTGFLVSVALITAGAAGNIFDCVFYGEIFNNPMPPGVATLFPAGGGYSEWFEGRVVDMLYFPFFEFTWPRWLPVVGGSDYEFFAYIFNIADSSICVGVFLLILFYSADMGTALREVGDRYGWSSDKKKVKGDGE